MEDSDTNLFMKKSTEVDMSIVKGESMDNLEEEKSQKIDKLEMTIENVTPKASIDFEDHEIQEIEEETLEQRTTRRTTLQDNLFKVDQNKPDFLPKSVDIRLLHGNVYLMETINKDLKRVVATQKHAKRMKKCLRIASLRVKNYTAHFMAKASLLLQILVDVMTQYKFQLQLVSKNYQYVHDFLKQWLRYRKCPSPNKKKAQEETPTTKPLEINDEEMLNLYNNILKTQKRFDDTIFRFHKEIHHRIESVVSKGDYRELLIKIEKYAKIYSSVFSQTMRYINEGEDIFSNLDPHKNLFVLEHKICALMKVFRECLDKKVIFKVYSFSQEVDKVISSHHQYLQKELNNFNEAGGRFYKDWPTSHNNQFLISALGNEYQPINFFKICSPIYRKYMKKKLGLSLKSKVKNEDLVDFFEYFGIKYAIETPLIVNFIKCYINSPNSEPIQTLLCLDVS